MRNGLTGSRRISSGNSATRRCIVVHVHEPPDTIEESDRSGDLCHRHRTTASRTQFRDANLAAVQGRRSHRGSPFRRIGMTSPWPSRPTVRCGSAVSFKTSAAGASYRGAMSTPRLAVFGIVVADMAASLAFYRRLGLDLAPTADAEPHVALDLPGGLQLTWDTVDTIRSFDAGWEPPTGDPRSALAFDCGTPAEVDRLYGELIAAGHVRAPPTLGCVLGDALRVTRATQTATASTCSPCCLRAGEVAPGRAGERPHITSKVGLVGVAGAGGHLRGAVRAGLTGEGERPPQAEHAAPTSSRHSRTRPEPAGAGGGG